MNPAMTPKTQSVCKCVHCEKSVYFEGNYWLLQSPATGQKYEMCAKNPNGRHEVEPVAEPASTGEPPDYRYREVAELAKQYAGQPPSDISVLARAVLSFLAARPSEPSAPPCDCSEGKNARLYEHHKDCHWLQFVTRPENNPPAPQTSASLTCPHGFGPDQTCIECEPAYPNQNAAAPQPVSGDAPKVEELLDELIVVADWSNTAAPAGKRIERLTQLKTELLAYFPPASQTPESK